MYVQDAYELRKRFLIHLLTFKGNQYANNIPEVLRDYLVCYIGLTTRKAWVVTAFSVLMIVKKNCISTLDFLSISIDMQFATKVYDLNNLSILLLLFLKLARRNTRAYT
jgi:hypothetical protein